MNSLKDYMKNVNSQPQADSSASKAATSGPAAPKVVPTTTDIAGKVRAAASGQKITTPQTQTSAPAADQTAAGSAASSGMSSLKDYMAKKTGRNTGSTAATQPASAGIPRMKTIWSDPKARQTVLGNMGKDFEGYDGSWDSAKSFLPGMEKGLGLQSSMIDTWQKEAEDLSRSLTAQYKQLEQMQADPMTTRNPYAAKRYSDAIDRYNKELEEYKAYVADIEKAATQYGTHYEKYKSAGDVYAGGQKSLPKWQQKVDSVLGADRTQVTDTKTDWWKLVKGTVSKGANQVNQSFWNTVNMFLGGAAEEVHTLGTEALNGVIDAVNLIPGVNINNIEGGKNFITRAYEDAQRGFQNSQEKYNDNANSSRAAQIIDKLGTSTVAAIPMALEAIILKPYYAAQAAVGVGTKGLEYFSSLQNAKGLQAVSTMAVEGLSKLFKNPQFWTSYLNVAGDGYEDARKDGMKDSDALIYGTVNGFFNAMIEIGGADEALGGIQNLPMRLDQMKNEAGKKQLVEWFKDSVLGEGLEEVQQGAFERGMKAATTPDNGLQGFKDKWFSVDPTNQDAVFNPFTAAQEFTGGAAVGGILGGAQVGTSKALQGLTLPSVTEEDTGTKRTTKPEAERPTSQQFYDFMMRNGDENMAARNRDYVFMLYRTDEGDAWIGQIYEAGDDGRPKAAIYETAERTKEDAARRLANRTVTMELTREAQPAGTETGKPETGSTLDSRTEPAVESELEVKGLSLPSVETETPARTITPASGTMPQPETEGGITNGESEQFRPAAAGPLPAAGTAGTVEPAAGTAEPAATGDNIPDGDGGRLHGEGSGVEDRRLGEGSGRVQKNWKANQAAAASKRRINAQTAGETVRLSAQEIGVPNGTAQKNLTVYPENLWDDELKVIDADTFSKTGQHVTFVIGSIDRTTSDGTVVRSKGLRFPDGREIVRVDHTTSTASQIHDHEDWHRMEAEDPGLHSAAINALLDAVGSEQFNKIYDKYVTALWGTMNLPEHATNSDIENICRDIEEEMLADIHGGINFQGIGADRYKRIIDAVIADRSPTRQTAAATASTTGPPKYSYGGMGAENTDRSALEEAMALDVEGEDNEEIRKRTGWFRGMDGKWRFEFDDSSLSLKQGWKRARTLGQLIDHQSLFDHYPALKYIPVMFDENEAGAYYDITPGNYSLHLGRSFLNGTNSKRLNTIAHEVQHAIQMEEGFTTGGDANLFQGRKESTTQQIMDALRQEMENLIANVPEEYKKKFRRFAYLNESGQYGDEINRLVSELNAYDTGLMADYGFRDDSIANLYRGNEERYRNLAGEIESNDVSRRRTYTPLERYTTPPQRADAATVYRENYVDQYGQMTPAASESASEYGEPKSLSLPSVPEKNTAADIDDVYIRAVEEGNEGTARRMTNEAARAAGYNIHAFHGTKRGDRVGNKFLPERSTSGPMAFFTDNRQIAENYARDKNDTSLAYDEEYSDYYQQFRVTRNGKSIPVSDLWRSMTPAEKRTMTERAKHITFDDDYENIIYDRNAKYGLGNMDPYTINSHNGNVIDALIESWLVDGNIYREEGRFLEVLKLAGIDNVEYRDPDAKHEKVYDTYLKINNPFNTVEDVNEDFARGLEEWYAQQDPARYKKESAGADLWDKNNWTAEHWIEKLRENIADGTTTAWTSIPDFVTDYLKYLGYDGIQDVGGKGGGEGHTVWIPFSGEQVKTVDAATYDDSGNIIPISQRFNQNINDIRYSSDEEEADYPEGLSLPVPEKERQKAPADSRKLITKLRDSIPELENMETLAAFTGSEFRKGDQNLVDQVGKFFASLGNSVYRDGFGPIIMDENSVKADIAHGIGRIKAASFSVVPAVLRSGKEIDFQENWEGRGRDSHIFAGPVKMGDNKVYIAAVVMRGRDNRFYVHEAVDENGNLIYSAKKSPADIQTEVTAQGGIIGSAEDSDNSLAEPKRPVKTDFSTDDQTTAERRRAAEERKERRREAEERERLAAAGASPDVQPKTETPKATPKESKPVLAKKNLRNQMFAAFSIPEGRRAELGAIIDSYADRLFRHGEITQADRDALLDRLYSEGVMTVKHDDSGLEEHPRIYISPEVRAEFGEDWNEFRRRAFANGIYFTNNKADRGADSWQQTLAGKYAGIYDENTDMRSFLESLVQIAQDSKDEHMTLDEYNAYIANQEGVDEDLLRDREMTNLERQLDNALRNFAEQANLEVYYRGREDRIRQDERRKAYEGSKEYAARQAAKEAKEKERRNQMAQQNRENRELREMQQRTLKQLQWLSKNRYRMPEQLAETAKEILSDLDIYAAGAARATNYSKRYEATWEDIAKIYKEARATDPNFFPSQDLERIVARLDNAKIADLDPAALADLYKAAVGLRTEFYNKQNLINDQNHALFADVYADTREEMAKAPKDGKDNEIIKSLNLEMMTPANVLQMLFGWDKSSTGNRIAQQLVDGERAMKAYEVGAKAILDDFIEEHQDWIKKADGQGKDAIWYEIEVPELLELRMGDKPIFGKTVKVYMTPAQKVQLAIESKSRDNLRHMLGGRTFVNKDLYSKGKRAEAFAQGTTIKLAPETVESIIKDLTPEERELADILGNRYYNDYSGKKIDEVSVPLYGYKKTMGGWYAPIFTNQNYTNNEAGLFDVTAEGVGNLKQRQVSKNPSYNISAFDAFERNINMTKRFVGMAIPARNWQTLMNWQGDGTSFKDELTHMWGNEYKEYIQNLITRLQAGGSQGLKEAKLEKATNKLLGNYITSVFGANPGIVFKQAASFPQFAAVMGWDTMPTIGQLRGVDTDLMRTYTPELAYRMLGYSTPETATLKENPSRLDTNPVTKFFLRGGAITWMDGATVQRAWPWAENYVRKNFPDLEVGSEQDISEGRSPFYKKVAEVFNEAVGTTQPMYDEMHRPNIMKDSRGVQRAFTMFKTVPLQQYNTMRKAAGEAAAAKEEYKRAQSGGNDIRKQEAESNYKDASKRMANAVTATIASVMLFNLIGFVDQLWRNRGKKYRDDDGNLTWNSVAQGLFSDSIDSVTGMVIYGQELTDLITNLVTGEKWYGIEIPGGEQLDEIIDQISTAADTIRKVITDVADITAGGGDPTEYWRRHAGDFAGAIKDVAFTFSKYYNGLSAENVEKYIMGTLMTISPQTYTMLQDYFDTPAKYNLKGLSGEQFTQRAGDLFGSRNINVTDSMLRQLEQMYNDGYTDVIPSETAGTVTVNGNKYSLGANAQQIYDNTFAEYVNSGLEEILAGGLNEREASKAAQTLYNYAAAKAKEAAAADQLSEADAKALKKSTATADEVIEHGVTLPEWSEWKGITSEKFPDEDEEGEERSANTVEKLGMLRDFDVSDETKKALYGYLRGGYEMETEAGNPTNYAKMLDLTSRNMTIDEFIDWSIAYTGADKETDKLEALRDFNASEAAKQDLFGFIKGGREMETETGSPTQYAKMIAATKAGLTTDEYCDWLINTADMKKDNEKLDYLVGTDFSDKEKLALIGNLMGTDMQTASGNPTQYAKIKTLNDSGISIDDCIDLKLTDALDRYYNAQTKNKVASGDSAMTGMIITIEDELDKLKPANGDTQVDDFQKFEVIYRYGKQNGLNNNELLDICKVYASYDSYIPKLELSMKHNVGIDTYCRARTAMRQESMANDNNITITTKEAAAALTKMVERGQITKEEAAVLYQLQQKNWGYKNNPFSREIGKQVYEELNSSGTTSSGSSSTSGSGTTSGSASGTASQGLSGLKLPSLPGVAGGTQSSSQQQAQQSANTGTEYPAGLSLPSPYGDRDRNGSTSGTGIPPLPEQQEQLRGLSLPTIGH